MSEQETLITPEEIRARLDRSLYAPSGDAAHKDRQNLLRVLGGLMTSTNGEEVDIRARRVERDTMESLADVGLELLDKVLASGTDPRELFIEVFDQLLSVADLPRRDYRELSRADARKFRRENPEAFS